MHISGTDLLAFVLDKEFRIRLAFVVDDELAKYQPDGVALVRADNGMERRLMRLLGTVISVTIAARARRLTERRRLATDEHVTKYRPDDEHGQRRLVVGTFLLWI